jgi:riboflavin transporter FmnP
LIEKRDMNAKAVAMCSLFVALAIVLSKITIPVPYFQLYFWEIPIVAALLLFGFKFGFTVATISVFSQFAIFPSSMGILFPIWNLISMLPTLVSIGLVQWLLTNWKSNHSETTPLGVKPVFLLVLAALILKEAVMPFVNYFMCKYMLPLVGFPVPNVTWFITLSIIYDAVMVIYTVPSSYLVAKRVNVSLKMGNTII